MQSVGVTSLRNAGALSFIVVVVTVLPKFVGWMYPNINFGVANLNITSAFSPIFVLPIIALLIVFISIIISHKTIPHALAYIISYSITIIAALAIIISSNNPDAQGGAEKADTSAIGSSSKANSSSSKGQGLTAGARQQIAPIKTGNGVKAVYAPNTEKPSRIPLGTPKSIVSNAPSAAHSESAVGTEATGSVRSAGEERDVRMRNEQRTFYAHKKKVIIIAVDPPH